MPVAKKTAAKKTSSVSSIADFKKKKGGVFELPSGARVRLFNPGGLVIFRTEGLIPNSLMTIVNEAINEGKEPEMDDIAGNMDAEMMADMMKLVDACTIKCIVEPRVWEVPAHDSQRQDDRLYVDEVDDQDKMFIFQWVTGGTTDLEQFRQELSSDMAALQRRQAVGGKAKRAPRATKK